MSRLKLLPWAVGVALLAVTLVGANHLLHSDGQPPAAGGGGKNAKPAGAALVGDALIVHGTVATEQEVVAYTWSPLLTSGRVAEVFVKEGQEVKAGDKLYRFDDAAAQADIKVATAAVEGARGKREEAERKAKTDPPNFIKLAEIAVTTSQSLRGIAEQAYRTAQDKARKDWKAYRDSNDKGLSDEEIERKVATEPAVLKAQYEQKQAEAAVGKAETELDQANTARISAAEQVKAASAAVQSAEAALDKARLVAEECVVRAKSDGVVERVEASPGQVVGPATRAPLVWLVPNGPRVVRAEVEPEFAFRLQNKLGHAVTIMDHNNTSLTYEGEVKRVGGSFLPKRNGGSADFLTAKPTLVLEVEIAVKDPAPPGKPPLRVGQPVRVSIGQ
jgi:multidrug resistance efflux pump